MWHNVLGSSALQLCLTVHPQPFHFMPIKLPLLAAITCALASCSSNEELQDRMDKRNESYYKLQERREIRQDARDDRYDAWFDRIMK
jgi:hypothetical protein